MNFGGALGPFLSTAGAITADGDNFPTPPDYPVPEFSKNSLILEVRSSASYNRNLRWSRFYQGGVNRTIVPDDGGEVFLLANDATPDVNADGWKVNLRRVFPMLVHRS